MSNIVPLHHKPLDTTHTHTDLLSTLISSVLQSEAKHLLSLLVFVSMLCYHLDLGFVLFVYFARLGFLFVLFLLFSHLLSKVNCWKFKVYNKSLLDNRSGLGQKAGFQGTLETHQKSEQDQPASWMDAQHYHPGPYTQKVLGSDK